MADNIGKKFEKVFAEQWKKSLPDSTIDRLLDVTLGYKSIAQVADFIGYKKPLIFYLECKTRQGASLEFSGVTQYDKLIKKAGIPGVRSGVILYLYQKHSIIYIPVKTIKQMKEDGLKSINPSKIDQEKYKIYIIPSTQKRVFMDSDYSILMDTQEGE